MKCPTHDKDLGEVPISKGNKIIGTNFFCYDKSCNHEYDEYERGEENEQRRNEEKEN